MSLHSPEQQAKRRQHVTADQMTKVHEAIVHFRIKPLQRVCLISIVFTATPDLRAEFPAYAARQAGIGDVPLLCATELDVAGALPRTIRLLAHIDTGRARGEIRHVYLHGAAALRTDLPQ